jgi:hypothetical protein
MPDLAWWTYPNDRVPISGTVLMVLLGILSPLVVAMVGVGLAYLFAWLGDKLNVVFSVVVGGASTALTATAHIPYVGSYTHGLIAFGAGLAACEFALVLSLGLASLAAPRLRRPSWVNGDLTRARPDILAVDGDADLT